MRVTAVLLLLFSLLISLSAAYAIEEDELLDPQQAFALTLSTPEARQLQAEWNIAEGYYLYRNKISFQSETAGVVLGEPQLPAGKRKIDEFFGEIETYRGTIKVVVPIVKAPEQGGPLSISIRSQGCADVGVCYPPQTEHRQLTLAAVNKPFSLGSLSNQLSSAFGFGDSEPEFLEVDDAFRFAAIATDAETISARWQIATGYYLYRHKFAFEISGGDGSKLAAYQLPKGEEKFDEFFGDIEVYHNLVEVTLPIERADSSATTLTLTAHFQGCAEDGICYPPTTRSIEVELPALTTKPVKTSSSAAVAVPSPIPQSSAPVSEQDSLAATIANSGTLSMILLFFGLGLLLAFTPCVFPMIPILSSIIVGQGETLTTRRAFILSLVYVLAMALTYTAAGILAGLFGAEFNLQAVFQEPWILITFSIVFVLLSLSMFGFYELQLPSALQSKLTEVSNHQKGGNIVGVAIMGFLSALIVGPCVAAPLAGVLIYISQTGDAVLGGIALFALSMGMGAPLLLIGISAGKLLPRAGGWMNAVKAVFGVMLLAVAIWMLERILPAWSAMLLWSVLLITSAVYMGATDRIETGASGWQRLWKGLGLIVLIYGALILIGIAAGNSDPLQPLKGITTSQGSGKPAKLQFETVKGVDGLNQALAKAQRSGQTVMLDFYADWCISCKEFDKYTFSDAGVISALSNTLLLKADVTANDSADQALLKHFGLIGPPGMIFFNSDGTENRAYRVVGFMPPQPFLAQINGAFSNP